MDPRAHLVPLILERLPALLLWQALLAARVSVAAPGCLS